MKSVSTNQVIIGAVICLLLGAILFGIFSAKPVNWKESYSRMDKRPFGTFLTYEGMGDLFRDSMPREINHGILTQLAFEDFEQTNYLFLNDELSFSEYEVEELFRFAAAGNQVLLAAEELPYFLMDSMKLILVQPRLSNEEKLDSTDLQFLSGPLANRSFRYPLRHSRDYFVIDGEQEWAQHPAVPLVQRADSQVVALRIPFGSGSFYLASTPLLFTNYYLLHPENHAYVSGLLTLLPRENELWWDERYKMERLRRDKRGDRDDDNDSGGLWTYLWEQEALRWALLLAAVSMLLYGIFEAKRTQRIIPVVEPLPNTTLDFTETVGQLYFQSRDHKAVVSKKIKILLGYIHTRYYLKTDHFSVDFIETLAGKSGLEEKKLWQLFRQINSFKQQTELSDEDLLSLHQKIEHFYREGAR